MGNVGTLKGVVEATQKGDARAFERLVLESQDDLYKFCLFLAKNVPQAQDLFQETYLRAQQKIRQLKNPDQFKGWLRRIARNVFLDLKKAKANQAWAPLDFEISSDSNLEHVLRVREVLGRLDDETRLLLILVDLEGFSPLEASEIIGVSESALRSRLFRARKEFVQIFESTE